MNPNVGKGMSIEFSQLIGKEKEHYTTLEDLYDYSCGLHKDEARLCTGIKATIEDWDLMMGGRSDLPAVIEPYLEAIRKENMDKARSLYLFLSPIFFYIHILYDLRRRAWRNAITWCGIFCERIVRNLFQAIDKKDSTNIWQEISKDQRFEHRNNKLKADLSFRQYDEAEGLTSLLKDIYANRSHTGPHDVPPPEPLQADMSQRLCLPVYFKYLKALVLLGNDLEADLQTFVFFFQNLAEIRIALIFPEEQGTTTPKEALKDLYRQGFFKNGKSLKEALLRLGELGFHWNVSRIAHELENFSKGKKAFLTRSGKRGDYKYFERFPPEEFFKMTM
jgi:hypothetical protein